MFLCVLVARWGCLQIAWEQEVKPNSCSGGDNPGKENVKNHLKAFLKPVNIHVTQGYKACFPSVDYSLSSLAPCESTEMMGW